VPRLPRDLVPHADQTLRHASDGSLARSLG
jgi:hypothetical protein